VDCTGLPEVTLGQVGETLVQQLRGRRYPLGGTLEVTERCNMACLMCYINQPAGSQEAAARELTLAQIQSLVDQLTDAGCLSLLFTGGEPLLRPDLPDMWRYAKEQGLLVSLFTNGTLLTPRMADFLAEWRPATLEITLYGATQETYERVTRVPGSYARCLRGIELALDRGLRLELKSVLLKTNRHELEAMQAIAEGFGVPYRFDGILWPRKDGDGQAPEQRLSPAEIIALDEEYPERQRELERLYREFRAELVRNDNVYTCLAGQRSFHIDSAGRMSACMMARQPAYDLLQGSFQEGWAFLETALKKKRTLDTPCRTCTAGSLCMQCPGWSQAVHGDDETPVDYVCEIGQLRAARALAPTGSETAAVQGLEMPFPLAPAGSQRHESSRSAGSRVSIHAGRPN
jgi:radical SAM protein with 4Fe4S-binding SPASM domain